MTGTERPTNDPPEPRDDEPTDPAREAARSDPAPDPDADPLRRAAADPPASMPGEDDGEHRGEGDGAAPDRGG